MLSGSQIRDLIATSLETQRVRTRRVPVLVLDGTRSGSIWDMLIHARLIRKNG